MDKNALLERTKDIAIDIIQFVSNLPINKANDVMPYQLLKCGTSIGTNYHETNRAESKADFIHKISIIEKEAAETQYWLELFKSMDFGEFEERRNLILEVSELLAIFTGIGKTSKQKYR